MRKSKEEAAETRARIIRKASREFNQHGIADTGLADVMKSAGLTHGGFYKHFQSKDDLVVEAFERGLEKSFQAIERSADEGAIAELINAYLSPAHRDDFDTACPLPALGTELWRAGGKERQKASEGVLRFVSLVEKYTMPPIAVVPMIWRAMDPAPEAIPSGMQPTMKASAVIIRGRKRTLAACSAASTRGVPPSYSSLLRACRGMDSFRSRRLLSRIRKRHYPISWRCWWTSTPDFRSSSLEVDGPRPRRNFSGYRSEFIT